MRAAPLLVMCLLATTGMSGCLDMLNDLLGDGRPDIVVSRTPLAAGEWNTDNRFRVLLETEELHDVRILATGSDGAVLEATGLANASESVMLVLPDGTWDVTYFVAGFKWETFKQVMFDTKVPRLLDLQAIGNAQSGVYTIGQGARPSEASELELRDRDGTVLSRSLPFTVSGLSDGVHAYTIFLQDPAGNRNQYTVQVRVGEAKALPEGQWTFGVVARYTNQVRTWDLSDMDAFPSPAAAQAAVGGQHLGKGFGIEPDDPIIKDIVAQEIGPDEDTTGKIAWKLYRWVFDNLEYDEARLEDDDLLRPSQTHANGGGVCRDLAGFYVSLLRAAGVPARVVSGYLAGTVNGFHAWVEFYAGSTGPDVWAPVDVSPIDGRWDDREGGLERGLQVAMQSFGIQKPEYLALRDVPPAAEVDGWSTALSVSHERPKGSAEPTIKFRKDVDIVGAQQVGVLCFDDASLLRRTAGSDDGCSGQWILRDFVTFTERIIDYGIDVQTAASGTSFTARLAFPFAESVTPDSVDHLVYGDGQSVTGWDTDVAAGKVEADWAV